MDKTVEPLTDDAELAKVLEGMQDPTVAPPAAPVATPSGLNFEETPAAAVPAAGAPAPAPVMPDTTSLPTPLGAPTDQASYVDAVLSPSPATSPAADPALESIKKDALEQLRPLVDKLDLPPEEKFDTLLLIIRSTDDKSLVQAAYDTAKGIADEAKRAEALLDIIKEIDYFSHPAAGQPQL